MRWDRVLVLTACVVVLAMYLFNTDMGGDPYSPRGDGRYRPVLARGDGHMLYLMARSTALDLDWSFDNDLARFGDPWNEPRTATGRKAIIHPLGTALVWTPLIWLAEGAAAAANLFGADIPMHGYTLWHQRFVFLSSVLFACGAVLLGRRVAQRLFAGPWSSAYAAGAILLGTSLTYYATFMPSYSHAADAFACAAFLAYWALTVRRTDTRRWLVLGLLLGAAALIRTQELAMGIVVAIEVIAERKLRALVGGAIVLAVALVMLVPQAIEWQVVFGNFTQLPQGARYTRFEAPMIGELLFSHRNGWFSTTPLAYAGVLGLCMLPRRVRLVALGLGATVVMQIYLNSTILDWWGGAAFGQRRLCSVTLPLVVGFAALAWRCGRLVARWPRIPKLVWHALLVLAVAPFVITNMNHVGRLAHGAGADTELDANCCRNVPPPLREPARAIYDAIGDPFEFPANALFAWRHGVPIQRWDLTVGNYPLAPAMAEVNGDHLYAQHGAWHLGSPNIVPFLVEGWSIPFHTPRMAFRYTLASPAVLLVPNLLPYGQRISLWLAPAGSARVVVRWNDVEVVDTVLPAGWSQVSFELPHIELHTNELAVEAEPALSFAKELPNPAMPVGVAVGDLEVALLAPAQRE